jgi:hypothetical protein
MKNQITPLNPESKEHRAIIAGAIAAADALGQGRMTAAREQLELNDIIVNRDVLARLVYEMGRGL